MLKSWNGKYSHFFCYLPYGYMWLTRSSKRDVAANLITAWIPGLLLSYALTPATFLLSCLLYFAGYLLFVCIYETGYLMNDTYAVRYDEVPTRRVDIDVNTSFIGLFIGLRILIATSILYVAELYDDIALLAALSALLLLIIAYNLIRLVELKMICFIQMSMLRFALPVMLPLAFFHQHSSWILVLVLGLFAFVYPRLLSYLEGKKRLNLPERKASTFLLYSFLLMSPVMVLLSVYAKSWVPMMLHGWYCLVYGFYALKGNQLEEKIRQSVTSMPEK